MHEKKDSEILEVSLTPTEQQLSAVLQARLLCRQANEACSDHRRQLLLRRCEADLKDLVVIPLYHGRDKMHLTFTPVFTFISELVQPAKRPLAQTCIGKVPARVVWYGLDAASRTPSTHHVFLEHLHHLCHGLILLCNHCHDRRKVRR